MMRIEIERGAQGTRLELSGKLVGPWVEELEDAARKAGRPLEIDTRQLRYVDTAGRYLLELLKTQGATVLVLALLVVSPMLGETVKLTLEDAVRTALKQNPRVQIAVLDQATAAQNTAISKSALLPQVSLALSDVVRRGSVEANVGFPIAGVPGHVGPFQVVNAGPVGSMPVFDLTLLNRWRAAKEMQKTAGYQQLSVREQMTALVVGQYLAALRQDAAVQAAKSRVELAEALYRQAGNLQKAGVGTGLDTLRANQRMQAEKQNLIVQQTQSKVTLLNLARLLALPETAEVELADAQSFFSSGEAPALADSEVGVALTTRPEMKVLQSRKAALALEENAARKERLPKVRFDGNWGQQGTSYSNLIPAYQLGGTVSVPVFTGGRIEAEIAKAKIEIEKVDREIADTRNQIIYEVKAAGEQLAAARDEVALAEVTVKLAREEVSQSRDRFEAGVTNNIEVVTAQDTLARANESQIQALYRVSVARADLARALGRMEQTFAK